MPFSTSFKAAKAVNDLVNDPTAITDRGVKGLFPPILSTPYPLEKMTSLFFTTTTEKPGIMLSRYMFLRYWSMEPFAF
jgi:hypothetical protein